MSKILPILRKLKAHIFRTLHLKEAVFAFPILKPHYQRFWHNILNKINLRINTDFLFKMLKVNNNNKEKPQENEKTKNRHHFNNFFNHFSSAITKATGSAYAFIIAIAIVIVWGVTGPVFHFSDTWQLVINTGTTIVTFLMVFIIQHSQNRDTTALQLKLNELIAASKASNKLINVEDLSDEELELMKKFYMHLSTLSKSEKQNKIHSMQEDKDVIEENSKVVKIIPEKKKI